MLKGLEKMRKGLQRVDFQLLSFAFDLLVLLSDKKWQAASYLIGWWLKKQREVEQVKNR